MLWLRCCRLPKNDLDDGANGAEQQGKRDDQSNNAKPKGMSMDPALVPSILPSWIVLNRIGGYIRRLPAKRPVGRERSVALHQDLKIAMPGGYLEGRS